MSKRLAETEAETQLTQDNADRYLEEEGDEDEVREFTAVFVGSYMFLPVLPPLYLTRKQMKTPLVKERE